MDEKRVTVYMMIGLPGAGKDTWIQNHIPDLTMVSKDDVRVELGIMKRGQKGGGSSEQETKVMDVVLDKLVYYVKNGQDVVINDINLNRYERNIYKQALRGYDVNWIYVLVETPDFETNLKRRKDQIPINIMTGLKRTYCAPTPDEYDEIIYDKQKRDEN